METVLFALLSVRNAAGRALLQLAASLGAESFLRRPVWLDPRHTVVIRGAAPARSGCYPRPSVPSVHASMVGHLRYGDGGLGHPHDCVVWGELLRGENRPRPDTAGAQAPPLQPPADYPAAARRPFCVWIRPGIDSHALRELFLSRWD